jgi:hypothetical protein
VREAEGRGKEKRKLERRGDDHGRGQSVEERSQRSHLINSRQTAVDLSSSVCLSLRLANHEHEQPYGTCKDQSFNHLNPNAPLFCGELLPKIADLQAHNLFLYCLL